MSSPLKRVLILFILFLLSLVIPSYAEESLPGGVQRITSIEGVTEYRLSNGLRVLLFPDQSTPTITVNVTYLVGSRNESYGETGMAHLLEHLLFKGSKGHLNIPDELSKHGADPNGTTSYDRTNYFESFVSTPQNLDWALSLESDRMVNSFIAKKDLDSEMTVVRNEFERGENNSVGILSERVHESAYLWHNYRHPTIGSRSDIEKVPIERLQAFYKTYYQPDNALLIVAGKFDENATLALIQEKFGAIPRPTRVIQPPYTDEPVQDGQREVVLHRVGDVQAVIAAFHIPADGHPDTIALDTLGRILSDPASGRLRQRLVDTKLAVRANASLMSLHDPGLMEFIAIIPKDENIQAAREALLKIAEGIADDPVLQTELDRSRARMLDSYEKLMTDPSAVVSALSEAASVGDWRLLFWERDKAKKLTISDLDRVAKKYLLPSNLTVGEFIPETAPVRATIPSAPDYAAVLNGYTGDKTLVAGEVFVATPANIEARTSRSTLGQIKLAMLPKKTRGGLVNVALNIHFGNEKALRNRAVAAQFAGALLMRGTTKHDMTTLRHELTANKTQMSVTGGPTGVSVSIVTDHDHLTRALELAAEVLVQPAFPEKEFDELKRQSVTNIESSRAEPQAIAKLALQRALSPYSKDHVRYVPTIDESLERVRAVTLADVKQFHDDFYGIGKAEIGIVGNFDRQDAEKMTARLFAGWKSQTSYSRVSGLYKPVSGSKQTFDTPDKPNAIFLAGTNLELRDDDPDYPALVLGNYMLGGGFLNSRLATRIRQKDGLSYGVGSNLGASSLDRVGSFSAFAIMAPQNEPKVAAAFEKELARALESGFTNEELSAAKSGFLQSEVLVRADDQALASDLAQHLYLGRDFHWEERYDSSISSLTPEQVTNAMKRHLDPQKLVVVSAGEFQKRAGQ